MDHKQYIKTLVARGKLSKAIEEFLRGAAYDDDLTNSVIGLSGRQYRNESAKQGGVLSNDNYKIEQAQIQQALTYFLEDYKPPADLKFDASALNDAADKGEAEKPDSNVPVVFISYSHSNAATAKKIKEALEAEEVKVLIDDEQLDAGENIGEFIKEMARQSNVTLSLVSKKSLLSRWVGMETILSLQRETFFQDKKFIACAVESEFFEDEFVDDCLDEIYDKIDKYNQRIAKRKARNATASTIDLDSKLRLYQDLSNEFPKIIDRLNETLTLNVSGDYFEGSMKKIIDTIKGD